MRKSEMIENVETIGGLPLFFHCCWSFGPGFCSLFFCLLFFYGLVSVFVCTCVCMGLRFSLLRLHHTHAKYLNCCAYLNHMQHIVRPSTCIYTQTQIRNAQKTIYSLAATIIIVTSWKYNSHRKEERERDREKNQPKSSNSNKTNNNKWIVKIPAETISNKRLAQQSSDCSFKERTQHNILTSNFILLIQIVIFFSLFIPWEILEWKNRRFVRIKVYFAVDGNELVIDEPNTNIE